MLYVRERQIRVRSLQRILLLREVYNDKGKHWNSGSQVCKDFQDVERGFVTGAINRNCYAVSLKCWRGDFQKFEKLP